MTRFFKTLLFLACTMTLQAADRFPMSAGNLWIYRDAVTGGTFEIRVGTPLITNDKVYHPVTGLGAKTLQLRVNEFGNLAYWDEERGTDLLITSFETERVGEFEAYGRQCASTGKASAEPKEYSGPGGHWTSTLVEFRPYGCADAGELSEQYVENIGMVQRVVSTIAGPRTYDLVYARIGNQVIDAGEKGRFTVTALPGANKATWLVTLRVDPSNGPLRVQFPSSQEYDLRLRDSQRRIVWAWSADKLFAQVVHTKDVGGFTATVEIPYPPNAPEAITNYTIEAWLTTSPNQPQFAAATAVTLYPETAPAGRAAYPGRSRR